MKRFLIGLGIVFLFLPISLLAQSRDYTVYSNTDESNNNTNPVLPDNMEEIKFGGLSLILPKGAKIELNGSLVTVEDMSRYMSRKFEEIDMRLNKIEQKLEEQNKNNGSLKTTGTPS